MGRRMMKYTASILFALTLTSACGSEAEPARGSGYSSECGGFGEASGLHASAASGDTVARAYCDASMLYWSYDEATATLHVRHTRTEMNCGAIPAVEVRFEDGVFQILEKELLEEPPYGCQCVFDFDVLVEDVPPDVVALEIWQRDLTEAEGKGTRLWSGTLDVGPGTGEIVLDAEESFWCDQDAP
jgi:hypothetical protein